MIWDEVQAERERAHAKHGDTSMEALDVDDLTRLTVLMEEVGEVAREFNEARHSGTLNRSDLRKELIQVAAMAGAWADALTGPATLIQTLNPLVAFCPRCAQVKESPGQNTHYDDGEWSCSTGESAPAGGAS